MIPICLVVSGRYFHSMKSLNYLYYYSLSEKEMVMVYQSLLFEMSFLFDRFWFSFWLDLILFLKCALILCPDCEHFIQKFRFSGFPLKFGSVDYICRTTLIAGAIYCSITRMSTTVRLSLSMDILIIEYERAEFVFIFCLSMCVLAMSSCVSFLITFEN